MDLTPPAKCLPSAIPPDFSQTAVFRAQNVSSSYPFLNQTLALLDAALQQQIQSIPGLAQQLDVIVGNQIGPFKFSPSFTFAPQIRLSFFRTQFGLPQSPHQLLQWLLDPTLQLRTDSTEFRQEFYTQTYVNFIFSDPPEDVKLPFILSKKRRSLLGVANHSASARAAGCVDACPADARRDATGLLDIPFQQLGVSAAALEEHRASANVRGRSALQVGPFVFPNVPTISDLIASKMVQIRTTLQDFLNLRPQFAVVPFASFIPTSRTGVQVQQRADGKPVTVQFYERLGFDTDAAVRETASLRVLTPGTPGFIPLPQLPAFPSLLPGWTSSPFGAAYGSLISRLQAAAAARQAKAPAPAVDVAEAPAPSSATGRRLLQADPPSPVLPQPDDLGFSVVAPLLFPITLLPQWQQFFFDWRNLFGIGNLFDFRVFNALLTGPYTKTTSLLFTPQLRIYLGQVKFGLPRSKNETELWLRDFTKQLVTDQLSFQVQWRINTDLTVVLTPIVPPRPPPQSPRPPPRPPSPPKFTHFPHGRRRLLTTDQTGPAAAVPVHDEAVEQAIQHLPPPPPAWTTDNPACAAANFPVLYNATAIAELRAAQNGTVKHGQWLQAMLAFARGLSELRTTPVPLECVPPLHRKEAAVELQAQKDERAGAPAVLSGRRLMQHAGSSSESGAHDAILAALAAARVAHNSSLLTTATMKALSVQLAETVFVTALSELILQAPLTASLNIQNIFQPLFQPYGATLQAQLETDFIAGKEALFSFLGPSSTPNRPVTRPITSG